MKTDISSGAASPMDITAAGHIAQYRDFVDAIHQQRRPLIDGRKGRRSVELVEAIYRSARLGTAVTLMEEE
jgi:predicted dehydrogenase